jgi:hypothetical protein
MNKFKKLSSKVLLGAMSIAAVAGSAFADDPTDLDTLFDAVDISSVSSNVTTILVALIAISVVFLGYRFIRKAIGR